MLLSAGGVFMSILLYQYGISGQVSTKSVEGLRKQPKKKFKVKFQFMTFTSRSQNPTEEVNTVQQLRTALTKYFKCDKSASKSLIHDLYLKVTEWWWGGKSCLVVKKIALTKDFKSDADLDAARVKCYS